MRDNSNRVPSRAQDRLPQLDKQREVAAAGKTCRADVEKQCGTERRRIQKVACIGNALSNFSDDCKAAVAAVATRKK